MGSKNFGKVCQATVTEWTHRVDKKEEWIPGMHWKLVWSGHGRDKAAVQGSCRQGGLDKRHFKGNNDNVMTEWE